MLMPDTPYLFAVLAVLAALAFAAWSARRSGARSRLPGAAAVETRSRPAAAPVAGSAGPVGAAGRADAGGKVGPVGAVGAELAETRAELAAARAQVDQLTERLRQAQAQLETGRAPATHADGRHVEVFVNLSRRLQSLVHREITLLDGLENEVEDPDLLKGLFQVDHLATRIRRHAENLAVLGGSVSRRQWSRPVALTEVLRSAIAEVEHYSRVKLVPPIDGTLPGHAVASVIHLVAELIENATMFAPPHTQVLLRAQQVTAGVAIEVEDRGLGMQRADQDRVNQLLANPADINLDDLLRDGRIGLYVVSVIARQHGIVVKLQTNIYGGTQAVVILPQLLIGAAPEATAAETPPPPRTQAQGQAPIPERLPARERALSPTRNTPEVARQPIRSAAEPAHAAPARAVAAHASSRTVSSPAASSPAASSPAASSPTASAHVATHAASGHAASGHTTSGRAASGHTTSGRVTPAQASRAAGATASAAPGHGAPAPSVPRQPDAATVAEQQPPHLARPPLPRRRSQTHMAPQLQLGPPRPAAEPAGDQNPGLMASFMSGITQGEADPPGPESHG
jgi:signal transduction histidine kinase